MSLKISVSLIIAFLLAMFSIFNLAPVELKLANWRDISVPLSFVVFTLFFSGAVYGGLLIWFERSRHIAKVNQLSIQINRVKKILARQKLILDPEAITVIDDTVAEQPPSPVPSPEQNFSPTPTKKRRKRSRFLGISTMSDLSDMFSITISKEPAAEESKKTSSVPVQPSKKPSEYSLSQEQRELALKRIESENG
ncbi:MAG: LapA family protein [Fibrobacteria bacterium]|nr:LapA family protein [Fibrobacteria bacterium]